MANFIEYCEKEGIIFTIDVKAHPRAISLEDDTNLFDDYEGRKYTVSLTIDEEEAATAELVVVHPSYIDCSLFDFMDCMSGDFYSLYEAFFAKSNKSSLKRKGIHISKNETFVILDRILVNPKWRRKGICIYIVENIFKILDLSEFEESEDIACAIWIAAAIEEKDYGDEQYAKNLVKTYKKVPGAIHYHSKELENEFFFMENENFMNY